MKYAKVKAIIEVELIGEFEDYEIEEAKENYEFYDLMREDAGEITEKIIKIEGIEVYKE
jgi:hypothetical protein